MLSHHVLEKGDGAEREAGVRGIVLFHSALYYRVRWEDGVTEEREQGDPDVWGFHFFTDRQGNPSGPLFSQIVRDGMQWAMAGPRPSSPYQNDVIPIEADSAPRYGYPDV